VGYRVVGGVARRGLPGFFLFSFFLSPLFAFIILLVMPNLVARAEEEAERDRARREEHERQLEQIRALSAQNAPPEAAVATSVADELIKLAALRDRGDLTDEEFQAQKNGLLNSKPQVASPATVRPWH
jgi:hypothetical protein